MPQQPSENLFNLLGFRATGDLGGMTAWTTQRNRTVWIDKAPPLNPPSPLQSQFRNQFRLAATAWRALSPATRDAWLAAARKAHLYITGYNLWVWYQRTKDAATIRTIERQTGEQLIG